MPPGNSLPPGNGGIPPGDSDTSPRDGRIPPGDSGNATTRGDDGEIPVSSRQGETAPSGGTGAGTDGGTGTGDGLLSRSIDGDDSTGTPDEEPWRWPPIPAPDDLAWPGACGSPAKIRRPELHRVLADAGRLVGRAGSAHPDGRDHGGSGAGTGPGCSGGPGLCVAGRRNRRPRPGDDGDPDALARPRSPEIRSPPVACNRPTGRRGSPARARRTRRTRRTRRARADHHHRARHALG